MLRASLRAAEGHRHQDVVVQAEHLGLEPAPLVGLAEPVFAPGQTLPEPLARTGTLAEAVDAFRRRMIEDTVSKAAGNWAAAARHLGLDRGKNLHRLAQRLGLTTGK